MSTANPDPSTTSGSAASARSGGDPNSKTKTKAKSTRRTSAPSAKATRATKAARSGRTAKSVDTDGRPASTAKARAANTSKTTQATGRRTGSKRGTVTVTAGRRAPSVVAATPDDQEQLQFQAELQTRRDFLNALLIVSLLINLAVLIFWLTIKLSALYQRQAILWLLFS